MFELLEITVGKDRIEIPDELSRQIDYPNLRSFLLMSQVKDNTSTIWLTVEPQWKGKNPPKYTFEITEGELKWMGKDIDGKTEVLFKQ